MDSSISLSASAASTSNNDLIEQSNTFLSQQQLLWWERFHQQNNRTLLLAGSGGGGTNNSSSTSSTSFNQHHQSVSTNNSDVMNQLCRVCGEPAAGFHFGAFTCEGCKSFFGRTYNNLSSISECKNGGQCVINKKNRTSCKACRLRKCLVVGMSKSGSRYGRRSNWFKIHCLLQEQSNNNNNNTLQSIQQSSSNNHINHHLLDTKLINKHSDNSSSSWTTSHHHQHQHKKSRISESPPTPSSLPNRSMLPDIRNLSDLRNLPEIRNLPNYGNSENAASLAAAAAAFWATRGSSLIPHLPSPDLSTTTQVPLSPFLTSPFTNRNFLFPYITAQQQQQQQLSTNNNNNNNNKIIVPERLSTTPTTNSPPPSSTTSSCCSSPKEKIPRIFEKETTTSLSGIALLRTLGPVQEKPMDLSTKNIAKSEISDSDSTDDDDDNQVIKTELKDDKLLLVKGEGIGDKVGDSGCKLEQPVKPTTPLDLTTKL